MVVSPVELYKVGFPSERTNLPSEDVYSARFEVPRRSSCRTVTHPRWPPSATIASYRLRHRCPKNRGQSGWPGWKPAQSRPARSARSSPRDSFSQYVSNPPRTCPSCGGAWPPGPERSVLATGLAPTCWKIAPAPVLLPASDSTPPVGIRRARFPFTSMTCVGLSSSIVSSSTTDCPCHRRWPLAGVHRVTERCVRDEMLGGNVRGFRRQIDCALGRRTYFRRQYMAIGVQ